MLHYRCTHVCELLTKSQKPVCGLQGDPTERPVSKWKGQPAEVKLMRQRTRLLSLWLMMWASLQFSAEAFLFLMTPRTSHKDTQCVKLLTVVDSSRLCSLLRSQESEAADWGVQVCKMHVKLNIVEGEYGASYEQLLVTAQRWTGKHLHLVCDVIVVHGSKWSVLHLYWSMSIIHFFLTWAWIFIAVALMF